MADISIDQKKLPGVKEVCRDFAVLEDHTLAHNLQEQEIETHLASNIQKNRLVQHDLKVAKKLQEEEDMKARVRHQQRHKAMERSDKEIAHEIQELLVKQAEQIRKQEETDEVIARKLQEQELKDERRRKKVPHEVPHEDMYYKENGDHGRPRNPEYTHQEYQSSRQHRHRKCDKESDSRESQSFFYNSSHDQRWTSVPSASSQKSDYVRDDTHGELQSERVVRRKERPQRPPPPKHDGEYRKRGTHGDPCSTGNHHWSAEEDNIRELRHDQQKLPEWQEEVVENECLHHTKKEKKVESLDLVEEKLKGKLHSQGTGRKSHGDYSTQDMLECVARLDLQERSLTDLEVARRMQEEELQASEMDRRAAQVAQDEEIARLLMEEEKKSFKRSKERERGSMEKRRQDPHWKPGPEDVVRPRTHNTHEAHLSRNDRPIRPPQPVNSYENVSSDYDYPRSPCSSRPISRSEAPYKGSYYRE
ncbi:coiled-coil domain-containing protein 50 isoform X1 [Erpetoichthys calabaricus]|uniref:coiled-coil domain-containing protein 50 isoform X1 n=1 Tax=Erpetoichthys calabaricus TaxID=27687 RepID=UPI002234930F|nr:coiled-coil domain-containing protein 50 isoform X1 [Erpetoichthys calabaricus]